LQLEYHPGGQSRPASGKRKPHPASGRSDVEPMVVACELPGGGRPDYGARI
jgi:hypothetical protein